MAYRPAIEGNELYTYNIGSNMEEYIYKAKVFRCVFAFVYVHFVSIHINTIVFEILC